MYNARLMPYTLAEKQNVIRTTACKKKTLNNKTYTRKKNISAEL